AGAHRQAHGRARRGARPSVKRRLIELAHARSGDKGDTANVGLIAKKPAFYPILVKQVTAARVARHFKGMITGPVERFELPNLNARSNSTRLNSSHVSISYAVFCLK